MGLDNDIYLITNLCCNVSLEYSADTGILKESKI